MRWTLVSSHSLEVVTWREEGQKHLWLHSLQQLEKCHFWIPQNSTTLQAMLPN